MNHGTVRSSRRQLLAAGGAAVALAACGSSKSASRSTTANGGGYTIASRLAPEPLLVPGEMRLAVSLVDATQTFVPQGPPTLAGHLIDGNGANLADLTAARHGTGLAVSYWPFRFTIAAPGFYTLRVDGDDGHGAAFGVYEPAKVTMPALGTKLAPFDTPTVADHRGVEPYCSLTPNPCPLHDVTLTQALQSGKRVVYMVGTPAHCQTGVCGPGLEFLVTARQRIADRAVVVHADVYSDNAGTKLAPAVTALGLTYEPVLYLCSPDGTIRDRLDAVWDLDELNARLDTFLG